MRRNNVNGKNTHGKTLQVGSGSLLTNTNLVGNTTSTHVDMVVAPVSPVESFTLH